MRIVFFGDTDFSRPAIKALEKEGYDLFSIIKKNDSSLKDDAMFQKFKSLAPDLCVVADYGRIIPFRYLEIPKYGFLNIHPSLLPKYRGPSPIQSAILSGETKTGITIMVVDSEMDHGPIVSQKEVEILPDETYQELHDRLALLGAKLLIDILAKFLSFDVRPQEQNHSRATYCKILTREDGKIDWHKSTKEIYNQIRALSTEPGTWTIWNGKILNIKKCAMGAFADSASSGQVIKNSNRILAGTGDGVIEPITLQLEGKKEMSIIDFINGHPNFIGSKLERQKGPVMGPKLRFLTLFFL